MNDAMFGLFNLGGAEILVILVMLLVMVAGVVGLVLLVVWAATRGSRRGSPAPPTQSSEPPRPAPPRNCPRCGTRLPPDAPEGLCPRCVLAVGLATQTEAGGESGPHGTRVVEPPPAASDIAKHFPQLEIIACLGRGGMGVVYKARQPKLNRLVALKILAPEKGADPRFAERFLREAQALARLSHPNIVTVHDFGEVDGLYYLLMEYVDGMTLRQLLQGEKLAPEQALSIVPRICDALQFAHEQGVVHRDIKPENVLLDKQGRVKIADFGIAKILAVGQAPQALTQDQVVGTPHYMAPEQVEKPQLVDHRADIYSLGVVFYEMLTGELPLGKFQPPSKKVQVDVRLDQVVLHALEKEPERRYQHASDVKSDVETIATTPGAAPASASAKSPGTPPEETQQRATCYFSTPERMRNCFPNAAAQIFICKGELRLETETLTFTTPWQTRLVIPLKDIEDLSIGQFQMWTTPWIMQYARMNFLALTYAKDGARETVHLAPVPPNAASAGRISEHVSEWFEAIQKKVVALKGSIPGTADARAVTISAEPAWNKKGIPLFVALLATAGLVVWRAKSGLFGPSPEPLWVMVFIGLWLLLLGVIAFSVGFLKANSAIARGNLDAVTSDEPPESLRPTGDGREGGFTWVKAARWSARVLGTLLLCFYGLFVFGEGLPPIGSQPEGVQLSFAAVALMLLGFVIGWKREGTAALLIGSGWTLWHIAEGGFALNAFQTPLPVAVLYGFCWWATHGRRTRVVLWTVVVLTISLVVGRLFCPTSVFVRGVIIDAETDKPIAGAELTLEGSATGRKNEESRPNARSGKDGRFSLYVGWYAERKTLVITAPDHATLTTTLGPRALGQRNVSRAYQLQPMAAAERQIPLGPFSVRIPDAAVELVAVSENPASEEGWWMPNGSPLKKGAWRVDPRFRMQATVPPGADGPHLWRQFVLRALGTSEPARVAGFEFDGRPGANGNFRLMLGDQELDGWQGLVRSFPAGQTNTELLVGVASGPFQAAANTNVMRFQELSFVGHTDDLRFTVGKVFERDGKAAFSLSVDLGAKIKRANVEYRLRAKDRTGLWHTGRIVEGQSTGGLVNEVLAFDGLRSKDIAEARFETRPVHWVEFRDVALHAGEMTAATAAVSREKSISGKVVERVLYSVATQRPIKAEDLDAATELEVPAGLEDLGEDQFFHWLAINGADLLALAHARSWELWASLKLAAVPAKAWNEPAVPELRNALHSGAVGLARAEPDVQQGFRSYSVSTNTTLPLTFAFQTGAGGLGVLQITGLTESPQGVKIRYKLVQHSLSETQAGQSTSEPGPAERNPEVLRVRLKQAEAEAERMKQLAESGRVSAAENEAAQDKVEVLKAELANDPVRVARVRLAAAERQLKRAAELWKLGRISNAEYEAAKADAEVCKAELRAVSPHTQQ